MPGDLSLLLILEQVKGVDLVPIKTVGHSDVAIVIVLSEKSKIHCRIMVSCLEINYIFRISKI